MLEEQKTHDQRRANKVFIGGNYDNMIVLREIKQIVATLEFKPVLAIDEYPEMPIKDIHATDLELLSSCEYAIFEETFPAGELMELERALDYGVKTLVIYQTRKPGLLGYPSQLTSMAVSLVQEKAFNDITLFGYPSLIVLRRFLHGFLKRPFTYSDRCLLVTSVGTLDRARLSDVEEGQLRSFKGVKILFTGWDFKRSKRDKLIDMYDLSGVVSEGSILYTKCQDEARGWKRTVLCKKEDVDVVKRLNELILDEIYFVDSSSLLLSQGDEISICYYVNPSKKIEHVWQRLRDTEEVTASGFKACLWEMCPTIKEADIHVVNDACLEMPDTRDSRYYVEKVNAKYRTFREYALRFEERQGQRYLIVKLEPERPDRPSSEETYQCLVAIIARAKLNPNNDLSPADWDRVIAQSDGCIDIFARTKEESWEQLLEQLEAIGFYDARMPIFYISRGTESDIPFIRAGYLRGNFCAFGLSNVITSNLLKVAGVVVKRSFHEILDTIEQKR